VRDVIRSFDNPLVQRWRRLCQSRAFREAEGSCLLTSPREIEETLAAYIPHYLIYTESFNPPTRWQGLCQEVVVSDEIVQRITGLSAPAGCLAELAIPAEADHPGPYALILDGVSDPSNVGTLMRTACVLGWSGVILLPGTADIFNDKALRTAKGAPFFLKRCCWSVAQTFEWIETHGVEVNIADLHGQDPRALLPPAAIVMGHETRGPGAYWSSFTRVHIPQRGPLESLNVAAAGAILMAKIVGI